MEPFDFDQFIKEKVLEEGNIHSSESNTARSGIWIDIQENLRKGHFISWYHLAASLLLLIIGFSIFLFRVQSHYSSENQALLIKMESLERNYSERARSLDQKEGQIQILTSNLNDLENKIISLAEREDSKPLIKTVYKRDTILLKTVEYVTYVPEESLSEDLEELAKIEPDTKLETAEITASIKPYDIIYPSPKSKGKTSEPEKLKISFGKYIAKEN